jgi:hypothetical protein
MGSLIAEISRSEIKVFGIRASQQQILSTHHPQAETRLGPRSLRMTASLLKIEQLPG